MSLARISNAYVPIGNQLFYRKQLKWLRLVFFLLFSKRVEPLDKGHIFKTNVVLDVCFTLLLLGDSPKIYAKIILFLLTKLRFVALTFMDK